MTRFVTVSLDSPPGFPIDAYNAFHQCVRRYHEFENNEFRADYAGGINGMAFRAVEASDFDRLFRLALSADGDSRADEESALFGFFGSAMSTLDCMAYSLHAVGAMLDPVAFPMRSDRDRAKVNLGRTTKGYGIGFPSEPLSTSLESALQSGGYADLRKIRNALMHRAATLRQHLLSNVPGDDFPSHWKGTNLLIEPSLTADRLVWLMTTLTDIMHAAVAFAEVHL